MYLNSTQLPQTTKVWRRSGARPESFRWNLRGENPNEPGPPGPWLLLGYTFHLDPVTKCGYSIHMGYYT